MATVRERRARRVAQLRGEGLKLREIAMRTGWAKSTVHALISDPDGSKLKARKNGYRGRCEECGGPTDGSRGRELAPRVCQPCREWSDAAIIDALRAWASTHGGLPPRRADWLHSGDGHPCATVVEKRFGWNNALLIAGFDLRTDRRPDTQTTIERLVREGWATGDIADHLGCSPQNIHQRLRYRGISVKALRRAA